MPHPNRQGKKSRAGFTLVELMVALLIGAMLLLGARLTLDAIGDSARRTVERAVWADRERNGERVARRLLLDAEPADDSAQFVGSELRTQLVSWCDVPSGGRERCAVMIAVGKTRAGDSSVSAALETSSGDAVMLRTAPRMALRYLSTASNGGTWMREWRGGLMLPLALGIVTDRDTMVFRIGERR